MIGQACGQGWGARLPSRTNRTVACTLGQRPLPSQAHRRSGDILAGLQEDHPLPQALVLTAIVISFATTALLLVVLLAARGFSGTDHVDGRERRE